MFRPILYTREQGVICLIAQTPLSVASHSLDQFLQTSLKWYWTSWYVQHYTESQIRHSYIPLSPLDQVSIKYLEARVSGITGNKQGDDFGYEVILVGLDASPKRSGSSSPSWKVLLSQFVRESGPIQIILYHHDDLMYDFIYLRHAVSEQLENQLQTLGLYLKSPMKWRAYDDLGQFRIESFIHLIGSE